MTGTRGVMYFLGVTTAQSASRQIFPRWTEILGLRGARLAGVDIPLDAPPERYRQAIQQIRDDPLARGATITTHKVNVYRAAGDLFDERTDEAVTCGEISCVYKRRGKLIGDTTDPVVAGKALTRFTGEGYWREHPADLLCIGAGGAGIALALYFVRHAPIQERPRRMIVVDRSAASLENLQAVLSSLPDSGIRFECVENSDPTVNDQLMAGLPSHSMVVNATGMGKDIPGSPVTGQGVFPQDGIAWELNYRGSKNFYHQANTQASARNLRVEDGWFYFLQGWTTAVSLIFERRIARGEFERMMQVAAEFRP